MGYKLREVATSSVTELVFVNSLCWIYNLCHVFLIV